MNWRRRLMVKLWVYKVEKGWNTIDEVPERYYEQVKEELGITE